MDTKRVLSSNHVLIYGRSIHAVFQDTMTKKDMELKSYTGVVYRYRNSVQGDPEYGWSYIGNTMDEAERRRKWNNPNTSSYGGKKVMDARKKYGPNNFGYEVLETLTGTDKKALRKELEALEEEYIKKYDSIEKGYNTSSGGTGRKGQPRTAEENARMVATRMANGSYTPSDETRAKLSKAGKGRHHTQETIERIKKKITGLKRTDEQRQAQSERQQGRIISMAARAKSRATKLGKPHPISAQGMANINANRFKIPIVVTNDDTGYSKEFDSMKAASEELSIKTGSIHHFLKTGNANKDGYKFAYKNGVKNLPKKSKGKDKDGSGNVAA